MDDGGEEEDGADDSDDGDAPMSTRTYARGSGRGRGREGDDANHAHYDDDESYEAILSMDDGYGSGVLAEEQAAQSAGKAETESGEKARIAAELRREGCSWAIACA